MPCQGIRKIYNPKLCAILQPAAPAANLQQTFLFRLTNRECGRTLGGLALVRLRSRYIVIVRQFYGCSIRNHGKLPPPLPLARSRAWMAVSGESPGASLDNRKRRPYGVLPSLIIAQLPCGTRSTRPFPEGSSSSGSAASAGGFCRCCC